MLKEEHSKPKDHFDGYKHLVKAGQPHLEGHFLELIPGLERTYKKSSLVACFYIESIIYPFVQLKETTKGLKLTNEEFVEITTFIESTCCTSLFI